MGKKSKIDKDDEEVSLKNDEMVSSEKKKKKKKKKSKKNAKSEEEEGPVMTTTTAADTTNVSDEVHNKEEEGRVTKQEEEEEEEGAVERQPGDKPNFYSDSAFTSLPLSDKMQTALEKLKYTRMTQIQQKSIPPLLTGKDLVASAKTGSGKTLAFLIPCLELLHKANFTHKRGTGVIVVSPTRELALQIYGVVRDLCTNGEFTQTHGLVMGGANRKTEAEKLAKGVNLIVATPGRLLDHLQNTRNFNVRNLVVFVMDEADRILEIGFEDDLRAIMKLLPKERQTMLFSATQTNKVEDLVRLSIQNTAVYVEVKNETQLATAAGLEQGYVTVPSDKRFLLLFTFLKKNRKKKIMVFFSSCNSVKYHAELLNYIDIPVMDIHGRQKQQKRTTTFFQFCKEKTGTMLCTDVAARGLDIPEVDWIIQFDPPDDPKEYIHRVGRTARGATGAGRALLFLTPEETGFLTYLKAAKVSLNEYEFPIHKVANVQSQLTRLIEKNYYLNKSARDAYRSYLLSYASHSHKDIFDVHELDLQGVATAFGFTVPPRVDLSFSAKGRKKRGAGGVGGGDNNMKKLKSGHAFSASNPYGQRQAGDQRQFSH